MGEATTSGVFLFVSHVSEDRATAAEVVRELESRGVACWMAPRNVRPGQRFDNEIADAIDGCRAMLLIFSGRCNDSEYISREVTFAGDAKKVIIPFRIEDVQPQRGLRVRLADLHWIDAFVERERAINQVILEVVGTAKPMAEAVRPRNESKAETKAPVRDESKAEAKAPARDERTTEAKTRAPARNEILTVAGLEAWYGESHVLHGVDFNVVTGEVVTLLGRNGAGKTTTLKSIMGMVGRRTGAIKFEGIDIIGRTSDQIARAGIALCPEERGIFASLDVEENLLLPPQVKPGGLALERIFELFPNIRERLHSQGTKLSGGEQQMLAIARILRTGARLLLLDEPTEGLAPVIIQQIGKTIRTLKAQGFTIVLVEQNFRFASTVADRYYIMENGKVVDQFANSELEASLDKLHEYLGV